MNENEDPEWSVLFYNLHNLVHERYENKEITEEVLNNAITYYKSLNKEQLLKLNIIYELFG